MKNSQEYNPSSQNHLNSINITDEDVNIFLPSLILNNIPAIIYINDIDRVANVWSNLQSITFLGYEPEELSTMGNDFFANCLHPDDLEILGTSIDFFKKNKNGFYSGVYRMKHKNGEWHWMNAISSVYKTHPDGSPWLTIGVAIDITHKMGTENQLNELLKENLRLKNKLAVNSLTKREKVIVKLIAQGNSSKEIAEKLKISFFTVDSHRKNIIKKLDLKNTAALVNFAAENGMN